MTRRILNALAEVKAEAVQEPVMKYGLQARIAVCIGSAGNYYTVTVNSFLRESELAASPAFLKWLTDWMVF